MTIPNVFEEVTLLRTAIRKHRDQRGDDRCWLDDEQLYRSLPEGFTPPARDTAVELARCQQFIACRLNPATEYISPQRRIEELEAFVRDLVAWSDGGDYVSIETRGRALLESPKPLPDRIAGRPYKIVHSEKFNFWIIVERCESDCPMSLTNAGEWSAMLHHTWPSREAAEDFIRSLANG